MSREFGAVRPVGTEVGGAGSPVLARSGKVDGT